MTDFIRIGVIQKASIDKPEYIQGTRATDYVGTFSKKAVIAAPATNSKTVQQYIEVRTPPLSPLNFGI